MYKHVLVLDRKVTQHISTDKPTASSQLSSINQHNDNSNNSECKDTDSSYQ